MDLNLKIKQYFKLSEEQKEDLVAELVHFYYERWINEENAYIFHFTIDELLFRLEMEHRLAVKSESYERAEIYFKLSRVFHHIKETKNIE
jgi:hypothetical protein